MYVIGSNDNASNKSTMIGEIVGAQRCSLRGERAAASLVRTLQIRSHAAATTHSLAATAADANAVSGARAHARAINGEGIRPYLARRMPNGKR